MSGEMSGDGLRASIGLSQRGAAHSIDGASGNFSGDRLCTRPVGLRRAAISHAISDRRVYKMLDAMDLSGTNRKQVHAAFTACHRKFEIMRESFVQQRRNDEQETKKHLFWSFKRSGMRFWMKPSSLETGCRRGTGGNVQGQPVACS